MSKEECVISELIIWHSTDFPRSGRTVLFIDQSGSINFARYEPEAGELKIVSPLGATRLGNFLVGCYWADLPSLHVITRAK